MSAHRRSKHDESHRSGKENSIHERFNLSGLSIIHRPPIADSGPDNAKPRRESLRGFARSGCSLTLDVELKRHLHELLNLFAPDLRRRESHTGERILHGGGESWVTRVQDLERARLVSPALVDDELR